MSIKEKLVMIEEIKKRNDERVRQFLEEQKKEGQNKDAVQGS